MVCQSPPVPTSWLVGADGKTTMTMGELLEAGLEQLKKQQAQEAVEPGKKLTDGESIVEAMAQKLAETGQLPLPTKEADNAETKKWQQAVDDGNFDMRGHCPTKNPYTNTCMLVLV